MAQQQEWFVWSQLNGRVERALITDVRPGNYGMTGYVAGPRHDLIGCISVRDLDRLGFVSSSGYTVMSPEYWDQNETTLRQKHDKLLSKMWGKSAKERAVLGLSANGHLSEEAIQQAFRQKAQHAHPDKGGDAAAFDALTKARYALIANVRELESPFGWE